MLKIVVVEQFHCAVSPDGGSRSRNSTFFNFWDRLVVWQVTISDPTLFHERNDEHNCLSLHCTTWYCVLHLYLYHIEYKYMLSVLVRGTCTVPGTCYRILQELYDA